MLRKKLKCLALCLLIVVPISFMQISCSKRLPTTPETLVSEEYRTIVVSPDVTIKLHRSIPDSVQFQVGVEDTSTIGAESMKALASWQNGTRIRYGWDYDGDFYIDYKTPRSCCYRVSYTYALHYALQAAQKPLVVYGLSSNSDGTITWRIIIGASVLRYISPVADWFLMWQAKMQYYA